jgi:S-adenosylmethionine hydrolase
MTPAAATRRTGSRRVVALLTDFGAASHHAGVLRGVVLAGNPDALPVDLSHGVPAGDVALGAWTLRFAWRYFPSGTVHLAVVDPGVGTSRRALAAEAGGQHFVGPDNGLLSLALRDAGGARVVALPQAGVDVSPTFHGRDVFAPVAARISRGEELAGLGKPVVDWVRLPEPAVRRLAPGRVAGEVVAVDPWGNLVSSLTRTDLTRDGIGPRATVRVGRRVIRGIRRTYADAAPGTAVALFNSNDHLEIAVNGGRADELLRATRGTPVTVTA